MIGFSIKKVSENSPHYNITFTKTVHKRNGEELEEAGKSLYTVTLKEAKNIIAHVETIKRFKEDEEIFLKDYISKFHKVYKEICELLTKTL